MSDQAQEVKKADPKLIEKEDGKWSLLTVARKYRHSKRLVKYAGASVLVVGGAAVALPFLGAVMLCGLALGAIAFVATIVLTYQRLKSAQGAQGIMDMLSKTVNSVSERAPVDSHTDVPTEHLMRIWDVSGSVCIFGVEPTVQEIILANNKAGTSMNGLTRIPNDQTVSVLLDEGRDAVKIKVVGGEHNGHLGWVSRSNLVEKEAKVF